MFVFMPLCTTVFFVESAAALAAVRGLATRELLRAGRLRDASAPQRRGRDSDNGFRERT